MAIFKVRADIIIDAESEAEAIEAVEREFSSTTFGGHDDRILEYGVESATLEENQTQDLQEVVDEAVLEYLASEARQRSYKRYTPRKRYYQPRKYW